MRGSELRDLRAHSAAHARQDIEQIVFDGHTEPPARFDHRQDGRHLWARLCATDVEPVLATESLSPLQRTPFLRVMRARLWDSFVRSSLN